MRPDAPRALRISLDQLACAEHATDPATDAHRIIGTQIWCAVRALGYREGPVLAAGDGAAPLLGLSGVDHAAAGGLVADLDRRHHPRGPVTHLPGGNGNAALSLFGVVIRTLPGYDVRLTYGPNIIARAGAQLTASLAALRVTAPGGLTALVATHDLMDTPIPDGRRRIAQLADLVGAVRLPAGTHRRTPGTDEIADLLLLRRRPAGEWRRGPDFEDAPMVVLDGAIVTINAYFDTNIDQVLGTIQHDPTGVPPANLTVTGNARRFATALAERLDHVVNTGRHQRLTMSARGPATAATVNLNEIRAHQPGTRRLRRDDAVARADDGGPTRPWRDLSGPGLERP